MSVTRARTVLRATPSLVDRLAIKSTRLYAACAPSTSAAVGETLAATVGTFLASIDDAASVHALGVELLALRLDETSGASRRRQRAGVVFECLGAIIAALKRDR